MKKILFPVIFLLLAFQGYGQKMTVKDSNSHVLMEVNDEGTVGSILLEDSTMAPSVTTNKLYNVGGSLFWNGSALGTSGSAGGWTDGGSNVYTTTSTDKVGIGTSTPEFRLSLDNDGGIVAIGTFGSGVNLAASGEGTRLLWYPKKAALRAGYVYEKQWDDFNVGNYSMALGANAKASGAYSIALGSAVTADGESSTALGWNTTATGMYSTAAGAGNSAGGFASTSMGFYNSASGDYSTAMGHYVTAGSYLSTVIGKFNVGGGTADLWIEGDPLFEIGIGTNASHKANAVTVLKDGKVGIGTATPEFKLTLDEDGGILAKGTFGDGADLTTSGAGTRLIWYPKKAAFRTGMVSGSSWDNTNIGAYSFAAGYSTTASGEFSLATGSGSMATGQGSMAMGNGTEGTGVFSTALGNATTANGSYSTAVGDHAQADSYASMVVGRYNVGGGTTTSWVSTDPVFEIGIGASSIARSNAVSVLKNGNVGIGVADPDSKLEINGLVKITGGSPGSGKVLTSDATGLATWVSPSGASTGWTKSGSSVHTITSTDKVGIGTSAPELKLSLDDDGGIIAKGEHTSGALLSTEGEGTRLIWYPRRSAFRAGAVDGTQWNEANIGYFSVDMGYGTTADGGWSAALGSKTSAGGDYSMAIGEQTTASGMRSFAVGYNTTASGGSSIAMGANNLASGVSSAAMGSNTTASGAYSATMGRITVASGESAAAMGIGSNANSYASLAIGRFNIGGGTAVSWVSDDPVFEIGIGSSDGARNNAVTVLKNGCVGIGDATPEYRLDMGDGVAGYYDAADHQWHNGSSRSLKQDIEPNQIDVLDILEGVKIVQYRFKSEAAEDPNAPYHVGFIAEDAPDLLTGRDRNSMSTGDCIGLLLAVVKEQQKQIEFLKTSVQKSGE